jgi:methionyl-tRNA synthetase
VFIFPIDILRARCAQPITVGHGSTGRYNPARIPYWCRRVLVNKSKVLVCSAWPYASGVPHLGNLVGSLLSGDVFARYYRLRGADVLYVSGSDAHGTRVEYEAQAEGIAPAELAQRNHERILEILDGFDIRFDNYTTTESAVHKAFVREIYLQMEENGFICTKVEERAFCRDCEKFLADRFITGTCPKCGAPDALGNQCDTCGSILEPEELVEPRCNFCGGGNVEFRETKHWYLDLTRLSEPLERYVGSRGFQGNVHRYTQQMIDDGLRPRAMTRDIDWGIAAPFEGAEGKVFYVWGEAALGYVSAVVEHFDGDDRWKDFWFGEDVHQIYALGKDNIAFHTLIFPGQLIASGQGYHLPDQIAATEYLNWIGGSSFSKSRGIGLYGDDALGVMDGELWRFYLLYNRPEGRDTNFSWEELEKAVNGVLISNVANLMNRVLSFVQTRFDRVVPDVDPDSEVEQRVREAIAAYEAAVDDALIGQALRTVCDLAVFGNEYFQRKKPWETRDAAAVGGAMHLVRAMAILLLPYVPSFAGSVLRVLAIDAPTWADLGVSLRGRTLSEERVLLERIEVDAMRECFSAPSGAEGEISRVNVPSGAERSPAEGGEPGIETVAFEDFTKLDLRTGLIQSAEDVPGADRLLHLTVDLGSETRSCVAGIKGSYAASELVGRTVVVVTNLEPRTIRGLTSECMLLAAKGEELSLLTPDRPAEPGTPVS